MQGPDLTSNECLRYDSKGTNAKCGRRRRWIRIELREAGVKLARGCTGGELASG